MAIVFFVLGDCPGCGAKDSFGNVEIFDGERVYRGCKHCRYHSYFPLPAVQKKIVYLDQFFFSHAFRENDSRFTDAVARLKRVASLQLLVAPFSSIHEDETHQWKNRADLFEFIKATARGHKFSFAPEVKRTQIFKAFQAWLQGEPAAYRLEERDALRESVHGWEGYLRIDVGKYLGNVEQIRSSKGQSIDSLVEAFDGWRTRRSTYAEDLEKEYADGSRTYVGAYLKFASRINAGDLNAIIDAPVASAVVGTMLSILPKEQDIIQRLDRCADFFGSSHFRETPYAKLSCTIFATLRAMVKDGQYANVARAKQVLSGIFYDVDHVSTYAPYCDAFVMDNSMASLVSKPTVDLDRLYGTRVFSLNNWEEFLTWLDDLEAGMTAAHRAALSEAYPLRVPPVTQGRLRPP